MIFENLPYSCIAVIVFSLLIGLSLALFYYWPNRKENGFFSIIKASSVMGLGLGFAFSVVFCSLIPTLVTIDDDANHTRAFSFFANKKFIGIGGSYILNNSPVNLRLVGIGKDDNIDVFIKKGELKKVRRCPQSYFEPVPETPVVRIRKTRRGRIRKEIGNTIYLIID